LFFSSLLFCVLFSFLIFTFLFPSFYFYFFFSIGIKTPYDFRDLGYITGVKYLDQVESLVQASFRVEKKPSLWSRVFGSKEQARDGHLKDESLDDYMIEKEFATDPRRKSRRENELPEEIRSIKTIIEKKDETVKFKSDFINIDGAAKKASLNSEYVELLSLFNSKKKYSNSTLILQDLKTLYRMKAVFNSNMFYADQNFKKIESLNEGIDNKMIENNMDEGIIMLNLNGLSSDINNCLLSTLNKFTETEALLVEVFDTQIKKEKTDLKKLKMVENSKLSRSHGKLYPAALYLRKMRKGDRILAGLQIREVRGGPRIVVINAVGGIGGGKSGSGVNGKSLGSDTLIGQVRVRVKVMIKIDRNCYNNPNPNPNRNCNRLGQTGKSRSEC
jgi:hypothetical protein